MDEFKQAIMAIGLEPPKTIIPGKIIAFPGMGKKPSNRSARCFLFEDYNGGWVKDYSTGLFEVWQNKNAKNYSDAEKQAFYEKVKREQAQREQSAIEKQQLKAKQAKTFFKGLPFAGNNHPYLIKKKIFPHGAKIGTWRLFVDGNYQFIANTLILPLFDEHIKIRSLQAIFPEKHPTLNRDKDFFYGGQKRGCFWWIGIKTPTILIAEGFATAASLHESTGSQVFIAFDAGNLVSVANIVRANNPQAAIIICGDNDHSGTGQDAAIAAAKACGGKVIIPSIVGYDWNDMVNKGLTNE